MDEWLDCSRVIAKIQCYRKLLIEKDPSGNWQNLPLNQAWEHQRAKLSPHALELFAAQLEGEWLDHFAQWFNSKPQKHLPDDEIEF